MNDEIHNYVKKYMYKISKARIFFSRFEGTRGEKTKYFATTVEEILEIRKHKFVYFTYVWNLLDIAVLVVSSALGLKYV